MKWEIRYHVRLWKAWVQFCCKACQCTKGEVSENHGIWKAALWNAVMYPEGYSMLQDDLFQNSKGVLWRNSRYFEVKEEEEGSCTVWDKKSTRTRGAKKKKIFVRGANLFLLLHPHTQEPVLRQCSLLEHKRCQLTWPVQEQWPSTARSRDRTTLRFSSTQQRPTRLMLPQPCYSPATVPPAFHHQSPCDIPPAHSWHMA